MRNSETVLLEMKRAGWEPRVVYDIGANEGLWLQKNKKRFPGATFHCFEANENHKRPITCPEGSTWNHAVLSDTVKTVEFYSKKSTGDSYYKEKSTSFIDIKPTKKKTMRLDDLVSAHSYALPDYIKIDTQGSELDVFRGAEKCLAHAAAVDMELPILEYNEGAPNFNEYIEFMLDHNFVPMALDRDHHYKKYLIQIDFLFVRHDLKDHYWPRERVNFL